MRSFFKEDEGQSWFEELRKLMTTGGQTTALYLRRVAAVDAWLSLIGPKDPREVGLHPSGLIEISSGLSILFDSVCRNYGRVGLDI